MIKHNKDYVRGPISFANTPPFQLTLRELRALITSWRFWIGLGAIIVLLVLTGPFGTIDNLDVPTRIVYWAFTATTTFAIGLVISLYLGATTFQLGLNEFLSRALGGCAAGLAVGLFVWATNKHLFGMNLSQDYTFSTFLIIAIVIALVVSTLFYLLSEREIVARSSGGNLVAPFFERLPIYLGTKLISLEAQDHYIKVTTTKGSELILLRLGDAEKELTNYSGLRVHRSWWVAEDAIKEVQRNNGKMELRLNNECIIPVARSYQKSVRDLEN